MSIIMRPDEPAEAASPCKQDRFIQDILAVPETLKQISQRLINGAENMAETILLDYGGELPEIIFTGMGASYFVCQIPYYYLMAHGKNSQIVETSELLYYGQKALPSNALIICVTQSGETIEMKKLLPEIPAGTRVLSITNTAGSAVEKYAHYRLNLQVAPDYSVAVKTYLASIVCLLALSQKMIGGEKIISEEECLSAAESLESFLNCREAFESAADRYLGDLGKSFCTVGRGAAMSSLAEAALLFREGAKEPCFAVSGGQFRHGSVEVVKSNTFVVNFVPAGQGRHPGFSLTKELLDYGATVMLITDGSCPLEHDKLWKICVGKGNEYLASIYDIVPCMLLAHYIALKKGLIPGEFVNTAPVIVSE